MADRQPTIYDVAERAGVSIATVSRVLNGGSAGKKAVQKVNEAISALNYHPSSAARNLDRRQTGTIALVMSDMMNPYYSSLLAGAEEAARHGGYSLQVCSMDYGKPLDGDVLGRLLEVRPDGAVLVGRVIEGEGMTAGKNLRRLQEIMPLVTIGPQP